jgi:hypothetical protein
MTVKLSISVPDDVAAYLQGQGNVSAAVTTAVRRMLPEVRRERQRTAARAYGDFLRGRSESERQADVALVEASNDIALRGSQW